MEWLLSFKKSVLQKDLIFWKRSCHGILEGFSGPSERRPQAAFLVRISLVFAHGLANLGIVVTLGVDFWWPIRPIQQFIRRFSSSWGVFSDCHTLWMICWMKFRYHRRVVPAMPMQLLQSFVKLSLVLKPEVSRITVPSWTRSNLWLVLFATLAFMK